MRQHLKKLYYYVIKTIILMDYLNSKYKIVKTVSSQQINKINSFSDIEKIKMYVSLYLGLFYYLF